eukprot:scaffold437_cov168-Ochromonas_danica.AAC.70
MRINFSHATYEEANLRVRNLNSCRGVNIGYGHDATGALTNMRAIMLDTQGPEIRTGSFDGVKEVELKAGQEITVTTDEAYRTKQNAGRLWISYQRLGATVQEGHQLLIDDGLLAIKVKAKQGDDLICTVQNNAVLGNKKSVFLPGLVVDLPAMSEKDRADIKWGIENDIDYIAASFVRKAGDVVTIREYCQALLAAPSNASMPFPRPLPRIIAKVESTEALQNFDEILSVSDGIMVARGDLAVEVPIEGLANVQKEIVHRCNAAGKPVIVATQMLESMQKNPRPTRAESSDVANAIFDGADCVMLSGESAQGKFPMGSVDMMKRIVHQAELGLVHATHLPRDLHRVATENLCPLRSLAYAAVSISEAGRNVAGIVVNLSKQSNPLEIDTTLVATLSALRPHVPIFCFVPSYKAGRLLQFYRGVHPLLAPASGSHLSPATTRKLLQRLNVLDEHEAIVCLHGNSYDDISLQIAAAEL